MTIEDLVEEWRGKVNKIGFQFHTPFVKGDPLMLPFGEVRSSVVDKIIALKRKYPNFVINSEKQVSLMKGNWGGNWNDARGLPFMGDPFARPHGQDKTAMLHWKRQQQGPQADLRGVRARVLLYTRCAGHNRKLDRSSIKTANSILTGANSAS